MNQYEKWIWLELIGFDNTMKDMGVKNYIDRAGFVPDAVSLLVTGIDFILQYEKTEKIINLPADICSRMGHLRNTERSRQQWTNKQVRTLISNLQKKGVKVYLSVFVYFLNNAHHKEWVTDHAEVRTAFYTAEKLGDINPMAKLADGTYFEDIFLPKLVQVLTDYGFDGWHGADGFGDLCGPLYHIDFSDQMLEQFIEYTGVSIPDEYSRKIGLDFPAMRSRATWIWRNLRHEWIEFFGERTSRFWHKAVEMLHRAGKKAMINSCRTRDPFETLYGFGYNYLKIAKCGVDYILAETVAGALMLDPRPQCSDIERHYDYLAMMMEIKACMPDVKLVFLQNIHDVCEDWDLIRHAPAILEKEVFSLANVFFYRKDGKLARCADGLLGCLGDGIDVHEWAWLKKKWDFSFDLLPKTAPGFTVVWSDNYLSSESVRAFTQTRAPVMHHILYNLMTQGAPVSTIVRSDCLVHVKGPLLIINPQFLSNQEKESILSYKNGPIVVISGSAEKMPQRVFTFQESESEFSLRCAVYGDAISAESLKTCNSTTKSEVSEKKLIPDDVYALENCTKSYSFYERMTVRPLNMNFIKQCAAVMKILAGYHKDVNAEVNVLIMNIVKNTQRIIIKNNSPYYAAPKITLSRSIRSVSVCNGFPYMDVIPSGKEFTVKVPPRGLVVAESVLEDG